MTAPAPRRIRFQGTLAPRLFRRAILAHLGRSVPGWKALVVVFGSALLALSVLAVSRRDLASAARLLGFASLAAFFGLFLRIIARNTWRAQAARYQDLRGFLDSEGVEMSSKAGERWLPWAAISHWIATDDFLVLKHGRQLEILSRKLFASDSDWQEAHHLLSEHGTPHESEAHRTWSPVLTLTVIVFEVVLAWSVYRGF